MHRRCSQRVKNGELYRSHRISVGRKTLFYDLPKKRRLKVKKETDLEQKKNRK